jgi:maltose alpha-D-glucosyltransferase/alpha-amylase
MKELSNLLSNIYPDSYEQLLEKLKKEVLNKTKEGSNNIETNWYKDMNLYVTYPDAFCEGGECTLKQLTNQVSNISDLGCNAIHVLPFFKSPMIDMGFDISGYLEVRKELGGNHAFDKFLEECEVHDMRVLVDIVLNHVSFKHKWFQKAVEGNEYYRDFFICSQEKPNYIKTFQEDGKTWVRYEIEGKKHDIFLIFPDQAGEIPHWYKAQDGNWYYHTFYPHQIDLDWNNPKVFLEFAKILAYWAHKGISFRLDAIPFLGKDIKDGEFTKDDMTQDVVEALHFVVQAVSPGSVFLSEVAFELDKIKTYFGGEGIVESELSYNFPLNAKFWLSLLSEDSSHIWEVLNESYKDIPEWAEWVNFIRNHDALMVDRMKPEETKMVLDTLQDNGLPFAGGTNVCGRTYSFLCEDTRRHLMAYFLLFSLPGSPAIIYGDEYGKCNDYKYMEKMVELKKERLNSDEVPQDTRDISRGHIRKEEKANSKAMEIFQEMSVMLHKRERIASKIKGRAKNPTNDTSIFAVEYSDVSIFINLTDDNKTVELEQKSNIIHKVNKVVSTDEELSLGPYAGVWMEEIKN